MNAYDRAGVTPEKAVQDAIRKTNGNPLFPTPTEDYHMSTWRAEVTDQGKASPTENCYIIGADLCLVYGTSRQAPKVTYVRGLSFAHERPGPVGPDLKKLAHRRVYGSGT